MEFLKELYGDDVFNSMLLAIFEFLSYLLAGLLGSSTREIFIEKKKKISRIVGSSLITASILFATSSYMQTKVPNMRVIFGLGAFLGFYIPNFMAAISSGRIIKYVVRFFSKKLYDIIKDAEDEENMSNKPLK